MPEQAPPNRRRSTAPPRHPVRQGLGHSLARATARRSTGLIILALFVAVALLAPVLAPGDPSTITSLGAQPPSAEHLFGTTAKGQDVLALTVWGARSSLLVGLHRRYRGHVRSACWSA